MNKLIWYIKQLLPLQYKSRYIENGVKVETKWNMWFGRCFNISKKAL